ncbi:MAG: polymer-forming cytoskeletal protein [Alphaproteobacteria bacterium]|nr:polymer-forming cytoskeletal protein [Alphaproteobacteria bacterium]
MFSRNKSQPVDATAPSPAPSTPKKGGPKAAPSIISSDFVINGKLVSSGDIQIDGKVEGDIRTNSLTVGEKAFVQGEIVGEEVVVRGKVVGTIRAKRVQLASTCHVEGNILHEALAVEAGAFFEGHCRHSPDPLSEPMPAGDARGETKPSDSSRNKAPSNPGSAPSYGTPPVVLKPASVNTEQAIAAPAERPLR